MRVNVNTSDLTEPPQAPLPISHARLRITQPQPEEILAILDRLQPFFHFIVHKEFYWLVILVRSRQWHRILTEPEETETPEPLGRE